MHAKLKELYTQVCLYKMYKLYIRMPSYRWLYRILIYFYYVEITAIRICYIMC